MKKYTSALIALFLVALVATTLCACGQKDEPGGGEQSRFVTVDGAKIIGSDGKPTGLYGTNLGGWLVQEEWLVPTEVAGNYAQIDMMLALANRFGKDEMERLLDVYMDNWVSETDFRLIGEMGFNCVRIPFTYLNFMNAITLDEQSSTYVRTPYAELSVDENSFARLDWALDMCEKYGLYAILDMHGAVGSQSGNDHTGDIAFNKQGGQLWLDDETGETCRQKTKELWQAIATRYKNRKCVAMYDLLNEPGIKDSNGNQSTASKKCWEYFDELYKAIRQIDGNHVICLESCWSSVELPAPSKYGWENVAYQFHHYNWASAGVTNADYYGSLITVNNIATHIGAGYNVPVLIGEFNVWPDSHPDKVNATGNSSEQTESEAWAGVAELYCALGWNFTTWNFKHAALHSSWGLLNYSPTAEKMDEQADFNEMSEEQIATIWARHNSANYVENTALTDCILPNLPSFNVNGNDNRSLDEIMAEKDLYILTYAQENEEE